MRLYLIRHADAVPRGTPGFAQDAQRPLTDEGRRQAQRAGEALKRLKIAPDALLTSPYVRAVQTAEEVAKGLGLRTPAKELPELRPEELPHHASLALKSFAQMAQVALVGHEPHLSSWIAELTAGKAGMRCDMKKGGIACVEIERVPPPAGSGELRWLLTPKQLALIAKSQ